MHHQFWVFLTRNLHSAARRARRRGPASVSRQIHEPVPEPVAPPKDRDDFDRAWRTCKESGSRYRYLQLISAEQFHELLQVEIGFDLLGDILTAMHSCWTDEQPEDSQFVLRVLKTLPTAFRFELAVSFLGAGENQAVTALLEKLEQVGSASNNELSELRDEFKLK